MKTNADVIRSMTGKQLYDFLSALKENDIEYAVTFCDMCMQDKKNGGRGNEPGYDCEGCFESWLFGNAYAYSGLLSKGLNSGYVELENEEDAEEKGASDPLEELRKEVFCWGNEPAMYIPNYEAYARFINTIERKIKEVAKRTRGKTESEG